MGAPEKIKGPFDDCVSFEEGRTLYRKLLLEAHPDQGGSDTEVIELKGWFDKWVSRKAWEAHQSGATFREGGGPGGATQGNASGLSRNDPEDWLSDRTKQVLREIIESGINCGIKIVGSFIWLSDVPPAELLWLVGEMEFTWSKKYKKYFWADFDEMKAKGTLPRGKFTGTFSDMEKIHRSKNKREKVFLGVPTAPVEDLFNNLTGEDKHDR